MAEALNGINGIGGLLGPTPCDQTVAEQNKGYKPAPPPCGPCNNGHACKPPCCAGVYRPPSDSLPNLISNLISAGQPAPTTPTPATPVVAENARIGNDLCSPILIDTDGTGFHLTDAKEGVMFDFLGDGDLQLLPWPTATSRNGWLALPSEGGMIHSAKNLFGNVTPQPPSSHPNGFIALAQYDTKALGGKENGGIDSGDAIFGKLRVWIDSNHNGISEPNELATLESLGIKTIDLQYSLSAHTDEFGNVYRYKGTVVDGSASEVRKQIYDVFLNP